MLVIYDDLPDFEGFPNDNRVWRLDWFIGLIKHTEPQEPKLLLQLTDMGAAGVYSPKAQRRICSVGIGTLPGLVLGSVWLNESCLGVYEGKERRLFVVRCGIKRFTVESFGFISGSDT